MQSEGMSTVEDALLLSIGAIERGDRFVGKRGLAWVLSKDPGNVPAWLWMAKCIEDREAELDCYYRVLKIDPKNENALKGLSQLGLRGFQVEETKLDAARLPSTPSPISAIPFAEVREEYEDPAEAKLEAARRELLDLSLFNKLLNYRPLRTKGLEIIDEIPEQVFRILVQEGRSMSFLSIPEDEKDELNHQAELLAQDDAIEEREFLKQPEENENGLAPHHTDDKLQTPDKPDVLQKRLLNTYYTARTYIEEQGVNTLFLALGMLNWYESPSSDIERRAPLILVPVELTRSSVRSRFGIRYTEDEIGENLSLMAKLISDFGTKLPELTDSEGLDIQKYFHEVSNAIEHLRGWSVDSKSIALAFFSFGKFLMFNDLDSSNWPETKPSKHPVLRSLLHDGFGEEKLEIRDDFEIDRQMSPEQMHQVVDADSSQTLAITDVSGGRNLVIQGPPGTGKSQTITNLIAEAIGNGKTVLFVSEKMAALEVVKRRLDHVKLGHACLELHSQRTKKRLVLDDLRRSLELGQPKPAVKVAINELARNRDRLNQYSQAVNSVIGESGVTPYEAYGQLIQARRRLAGVDIPRLEIAGISDWSEAEFHRRLGLVEELQVFLGKIGVPIHHPFWGSRKKIELPYEKNLIQQECKESLDTIAELQRSSEELTNIIGMVRPTDKDEIVGLLGIVDYILDSPNLDGITVKSSSWATDATELVEVLKAGSRISHLHAQYDDLLINEAWNRDVLEIRSLLTEYGLKWWRFLSGDYRRAKRDLANLCCREAPKPLDAQLELLDAILEVQRLGPIVEDYEVGASNLFGERWRGLSSDWRDLVEVATWLGQLYEKARRQEIPEEVVDYIASGPKIEYLREVLVQVQACLDRHSQTTKAILQRIELDESLRFGRQNTFADCSYMVQEKVLQIWNEEVDRFREIITFRDLAQNLLENGLHSVARVSLSWQAADQFLCDLLLHTWFSSLIEKATLERTILARFDGEIHEHAIDKFCELDKLLLKRNRTRLAYEHWKTLPHHQSSGQVGILLREFEKKRRHLPIRKLIAKASNVIQAIKPVFMMSPLSIAMFLPPETIEFDMIIFDEASQVKPVDAFGAILRGRQIVVVGDTHQLPPTSFFESAIDVDDDYSESVTIDLESILGLCAAQGMSQRMLRWHYRSRHESLIAVSNYEFYDNKLVVFPSPDKDREEAGLVFHHLPDAQYDRGRSRANIEEARIVAKAVIQHAKTKPDLTLGVATFSISQMQALRDQLEILRRKDPSCEDYFRSHPEEPFFVKNLENVQGDERDVIFISVGYGRTVDGRISMNFGPINREGGERRLNVLITRARCRCEVFTNLKADDIDLSRTNARGVKVLKRFLKYADAGDLEIPYPSGGEADSPFEEAVARDLRRLGYRVDHQVGSGGFFIDLAVVDEDRPGRYLLGIECDGATYHSAKSARDRDRLRQEVLENLGWKIHRIWSTDWFRNSGRELQRVAKSIEAAKEHCVSMDTSSNHVLSRPVEQVSGIERLDSIEEITPRTPSEDYEMAHLEISIRKENLHEVSRSRMANWIQAVVEIESPVHVDEVARRIAASAGVKRIGARIRAAYDSAVAYAVREGMIAKRGEFLWSQSMKQPKLRSRASLPDASRRLNLIAPEEVALAVKDVALSSFGIQRDAIPNEVCSLLGFKRVTNHMRTCVECTIRNLVKDGALVIQGDYLVVSRNQGEILANR